MNVVVKTTEANPFYPLPAFADGALVENQAGDIYLVSKRLDGNYLLLLKHHRPDIIKTASNQSMYRFTNPEFHLFRSFRGTLELSN